MTTWDVFLGHSVHTEQTLLNIN